ncbi:putative SUF system FeS cluster assembly, SufBD [Rosa chinensis]|uniref:Putative SUF system FeS cluster assembly, SufBD n=1 Tax=Rosa chinensis TaxID=74649 RepID=A0A2P6PQD6_ROSCH|nr:protein ABCI7, chloroplastic [Rosa chinensis]PRQ24134.1 putative SUF system FeS cluster assembly, SufBD [Rosa chinensis]
MAAIAFTPQVQRPPLSLFSTPKTPKPKTRVSLQPSSSSSSTSQLSYDPFVHQLAESLDDSLPSSSSSSSSSLQSLRDSSVQTVLSTPWPTRKDEPFRFTDTSFIKNSQITPISRPPSFPTTPDDTQFPSLDIVDGFLVNLSNLGELPNGVFVGSLLELSDETILKRVSEFLSTSSQGDLFWSINGIGAPDLTVVYVPAGCRVESPIYLRYFANEGGDIGSPKLPLSNPRVLVLVEKGGEIGVIEEFLGGDGDKAYWVNSVLEVVVGEGGKVRHSYVQNQSVNAAHIKWTSVRQESASTYELVEISTGGRLSRHNLHVQQLGPDTITELSTLHLSAGDQTQDLHSSIVLDHPRGYSRQLHKCIVSHSEGKAVFDGNVKVNRYAQQTDGGQLTRSLLLAPRATVNVKPNLQIIADDVKCSHGAAISDLEETQLFYFLARGISLEAARRALVYSFGAEVIEGLPYPWIKTKVESQIKELLEGSS